MADEPTAEGADIVKVVRELRALGALRVRYRDCEVTFDAIPLKPVSAESSEEEYRRIALASAG